jgi:hypothetical protein
MPGTPSSKYGLPTLSGSDGINQTDEYSVTLTTALDGVLTPTSQGTLASRPASGGGPAGKLGRTYLATDTGQLFRDNGTAWDEIPLAPIGTADLADGAVTSQKLKPTSGLLSMSGNASMAYGNPGAWTDLPGMVLNITPAIASVLSIDCAYTVTALGTTGATYWQVEHRWLVDGADVDPIHGRAYVAVGGGASNGYGAMVSQTQLALAAGARALKAQVRIEVADPTSVNVFALSKGAMARYSLQAA